MLDGDVEEVAMRRFSGRVTPCTATMMAVVFVRRSVAQGQPARERVRVGSFVQTDSTRSASAK